MKVCVYGLWHLGCVTAGCLAEHFPTVGLDPDSGVVARLKAGEPPIVEPGLTELLRARMFADALEFTTDISDAAGRADVIWVTFDTPVDENDEADVGYVEKQISLLFPHLSDGSVVLISSQLPVGTTRRIEAGFHQAFPGRNIDFAYSPENLRLGKALEVFRNPERIVIGARDPNVRERLCHLLSPFCNNLVWMSVESAEMTKHAINAFLANSIAFMNEMAGLCERLGADAKQVEQGLKTDGRIGPRSYLSPGGPFAGGTLARDVSFLTSAAASLNFSTPLLRSIKESNDLHKNWPRMQLLSILKSLSGKTVAVLGLTYKPGTNTLRRSAGVELCRWLSDRGAQVKAFDPAVAELPPEMNSWITLVPSALDALAGSDAAVICTSWPAFRELTADDLVDVMKTPFVLCSRHPGPPRPAMTLVTPSLRPGA